MNKCNDLDFGDYVEIEQKRYGVKNEMYLHKVIGVLNSNTWVDVPVQTPATETIHKEVVPVVSCICCGVCEDKVYRYRIKDVILSKRLDEIKENILERIVEYKSEKVLPPEIVDLLEKYEGFIRDICREPDKLNIYFGSIRKGLINWFSDHLKKEAEL